MPSIGTLGKAWAGDLIVKAYPETAGTSAAVLNAAVASAFKKTVRMQLEDSKGIVHRWYNGTPATLTAIETVTDIDVAAPTLSSATPTFVDGVATVTLTYDTDANSTKTYASGGTVGFTSVVSKILGYTVDETNADFTDTIVA